MEKKQKSGDIEALLAVIRQEDLINVYSLADRLHWSYGKTERLVDQLVKRGMIFSAVNIVNGRVVKKLSIHPIKESYVPDQTDFKELKDAFLHLYGVFGELDTSISTRGLVAYCTKNGKTTSELKALFKRSLERILQTENEQGGV
ncbi:MAG: hypothetical protein Q6373_006610 [Candidatus Sigynarchaeota archaeon]